MAGPEFDVELFERRLQGLKDSQESIQGLSSWCLDRRQHHKKIVATWLQVLKKVKVEHRLTLFYLANDVIQYSKRKNFEFVESWGTTLQRATTMVRDEKVKHRILRIFKIWDQRQVYDEEFLADLSGLISAAPKKKPEPQPISVPEEFQASLLISTMRSCANLEQATDARLRDLREGNVDVDNAEELCASLKDRRHVEDAEKEVELAVRNVESYVRALEAEIRERSQVLELLEQADQFYETQRGEVKIVTNAYRNFGSRVKNLKKKLDELLPTLISPIPSPDVNAPSPSPDSDIELPGEDGQSSLNQSNDPMMDIAPPSMYNSYGQDYEPLPVPAPDLTSGNSTSDFTNNFSSFMGGNVDFDMRNLFTERSDTPTSGTLRYNDSTEAMPIEVINMRPSKNEQSSEDFSISNFLKTVLPSGASSSGSEVVVGGPGGAIPGLGLDAVDSRSDSSPHRPEYGLLSTPGRTLGGQPSTPQSNNHQMVHSTPLALCRSLAANESHTPSPYSSQNSLSNMTTLPFMDTTATNIASSPVNPLPPPPLPPPIFLDEDNCYNKLPPKFPTWTPANEPPAKQDKWEDKGKMGLNSSWSEDNGDKTKNRSSWEADERWESSGNDATWTTSSGLLRGGKDEIILSETPESPPIYEKSSFNAPIEYNDVDAREPILSSDADVDHRVRPIPIPTDLHLSHRLVKAADVDHRNLISLTGSPANNASNSNEAGSSLLPNNNNNVWSSADQNYRRQQGDIVESVDMEMSDEEADGKPNRRVLVDVRSQHERDLRLGGGQPAQDLDMRMIPLPGNPLSRGTPQLLQEIRPPPPPPLPALQQFHRNQSDFMSPQNADFRQQFVPQGGQQPIFLGNQRQNEFHNIVQDFQQQDFHQPRQNQQPDYDFHEGIHNNSRIPGGNDFLNDSPGCRGRYPGAGNLQEVHQHHAQLQQPQQIHREPPIFQRHPERGARGRVFPRGRRDRFGEENSPGSRQVQHMRRPRNPETPSLVDNSSKDTNSSRNCQPKLQPPDTCVVLDDEGLPITRPDLDESFPSFQRFNEASRTKKVEDGRGEETVLGSEPMGDDSEALNLPEGTPSKVLLSREANIEANKRVTGPQNALDGVSSTQGFSQGDSEEVESEERSQEGSLARGDEPPRQLSEHLEALMNSNKTAGVNDLKRTASEPNGEAFAGEQSGEEEGAGGKKRALLPNGPQVQTGGGGEVHPVVIYEYDTQNSMGGFRQRAPAPHFGMWRPGGLPIRPRGGFRGAPRGPWIDRGHRGPPIGSFVHRGKRGGAFRGAGGGFRGRGRGGNGW